MFKNEQNMRKLKLKEGIESNKKKEYLSAKLRKAEELRNRVEILKTAMRRVNVLAKEEDQAFKRRRLGFLSDRTTEYISRIFPMHQFRVKFEFDMHRGKRTQIRVLDDNGNSRVVHIQEGRMLQTVLAYASAEAITEALGSEIMYMDEPFSVSSDLNLTKVSKTIGESVQRGMQLIVIEQRAEAYKDLPRREFHLKLEEGADIQTVLPPEVYDY